jgi:RNA polymerase sigma factor (sigma-70 family)
VADETPPEPSDEELMRRVALDEDKTAFARLFDRYTTSILAYVRKSHAALNTDAVETIAQDVFIEAYRAKSTYGFPQPFAPWLFAIAGRVALSHWRRSVPAADRARLPEPQPLWAEVIRAATAEFARPLDMESIRAAISLLPRDQAAVIELGVLCGLRAAQITAVTGQDEVTVRRLITEGLRELVRVMTPGGA